MMYQDSAGSYLNVGDVVLYGKFKNAKGRILSFGKNEKGDPTIEVQPIDKEGKSKGGQPKTLVLLKVRKLTKGAAATTLHSTFGNAKVTAKLGHVSIGADRQVTVTFTTPHFQWELLFVAQEHPLREFVRPDLFRTKRTNPDGSVEDLPSGPRATKHMPKGMYAHAKAQAKKLTPTRPRKRALAELVVARYLDKIARGLGLGDTWENNKVRIHRYSNSFHVWDLSNAGKRGKKVRKMIILPEGHRADEKEWMEQHSRHVILNAARGYDSIERYFEKVEGGADINEYQERGIDILPAGTKTIELKWSVGTTNLRLTATPLDFSVVHSAPLTHHTTGKPIGRQDTIYSPAKKADAKRFYGWLAGEGEKMVPRMSMDDLRDVWRSLRVQYDYH